MHMQRVAAIMAGGRGERLWPHSRTRWPKQFLSLGPGGSLVAATYARLRGLVPPEQMLVLTAQETMGLARTLLPEIPAARFCGEPLRKDTAAAAALAVAMAAALHAHPVVLALVPADHVVGDVGAFQHALADAYAAAESSDCPVLVGVQPIRPETGYGYIRVDRPISPATGPLPVARFVEKPPLESARSMSQDGAHLWNSGICVCRTDWLRTELGQLAPALGGLLAALNGINPASLPPAALSALLEPLPSVSLDRALLERTPRALVVPAEFSWDDAGSWEALARLHPQDGTGNVTLGQTVVSATRRTLVFAAAPQRLVVTHGVSDLVIVDTPDSLLVAGRKALSEVKRAVEAVRGAGFGAHLDETSATVDHVSPELRSPAEQHVVPKPWGREVWWAENAMYAAKRLDVNAGAALSLQYHQRKHETLTVLSGQARLRLGDQERQVGPGWVAVVPPGTVHRLEALTDTVLFEVSTPDLDDVVRLEDRYGRQALGQAPAPVDGVLPEPPACPPSPPDPAPFA